MTGCFEKASIQPFAVLTSGYTVKKQCSVSASSSRHVKSVVGSKLKGGFLFLPRSTHRRAVATAKFRP